jgi:hypothetical protein
VTIRSPKNHATQEMRGGVSSVEAMQVEAMDAREKAILHHQPLRLAVQG